MCFLASSGTSARQRKEGREHFYRYYKYGGARGSGGGGAADAGKSDSCSTTNETTAEARGVLALATELATAADEAAVAAARALSDTAVYHLLLATPGLSSGALPFLLAFGSRCIRETQPEDMNALTISVNNAFRWDEMKFRVEKPKPPEPEPEPEEEVTWT